MGVLEILYMAQTGCVLCLLCEVCKRMCLQSMRASHARAEKVLDCARLLVSVTTL